MERGTLVPTASALGLAPLPRPKIPEGPYVVAGLARAGVAAIDALCRVVPSDDVVGCDRAPAGLSRDVRHKLTAAGVSYRLGPRSESLDSVPAPQTLIKSPGIPFDTGLIQQAEQLGITVLDELELGWRMSAAPMLAVTGTNGKTTVAGLAHEVLGAGGVTATLAGNTEHGPALSAVEPGADWIVCEVSSFQLEGCPALLPEAAVFTNLSLDHLKRHRTMRRYWEAKRRLFVREASVVPLAVIDVASGFGRTLADQVQASGGSVVRVGFDGRADYAIANARWDLRSAVVKLRTPSGELRLETRMPGMHNARNVAAAVALGDLFGVARDRLAEVIAAHDPPPGRLETLDFGQHHDLVLDTAASPDAVEQVLRTLRAVYPSTRVHVVLGVLGSPDVSHLHALGRAARERCDHLVLTAGSLRPNPPTRTIDGLMHGTARAGGATTVRVVRRRRDAIRAALLAARPGEVVAILGRGGTREAVSDHQLDDRMVLRQLALEINS